MITLKTTVYRTSDDSPVVPALIEVAEDGRQSVCLVELKARFDEHRNIEWSRALERAGVHVVYGFPNLKIHAKTTLIVRREGNALRRYVHIGTGNYHALTARIYEDFGLFTADEEIAADVADLFNYVTGFGRPQAFRKLLVAPFNLRSRLVEEIRSGRQGGRRRRARAHPPEDERAHRRDDHRGALRRLAGRRRDRHRRALDLPAPAGRPRPLRDDPRAQRPRALPRAQPLLRLRGGRRGDHVHGQRRPDDAQPRPPHRDRRARSRTRRVQAQLARRLRRPARGQHGLDAPADGSWKRLSARARTSARRGATTRSCARRRRARAGASPGGRARALPADPAPENGVAHEGRHHRRGLEHGPPAGRRAATAAGSSRSTRSGSTSSSARTSSATGGSRAARIAEAARCAGAYAPERRRGLRSRVEVIVTAPGRQSANGAELVRRAEPPRRGAPVRVALAPTRRAGSRSRARSRRPARSRASVAVCDVGGGSTEVGRRHRRRRARLVALRWTSARCGSRERFLGDDPPGKAALAAARDEVERHLEAFAPPLPQAALATGGTARALRKLVGWTLEAEELDAALRILGKRPSAKVAKTFGLHEHRARTLAAGAVILAALQARLAVPLEVSRAGLREGAALALLDELAASAA